MCDLFLFTIIIQFYPTNVYSRTRTEEKMKTTIQIEFFPNFFSYFFFVCDHLLCYSRKRKHRGYIFFLLDIHLFEQQKIMITHTHEQTAIKKERRSLNE